MQFDLDHLLISHDNLAFLEALFSHKEIDDVGLL
jgi:hypothetical protein